MLSCIASSKLNIFLCYNIYVNAYVCRCPKPQSFSKSQTCLLFFFIIRVDKLKKNREITVCSQYWKYVILQVKIYISPHTTKKQIFVFNFFSEFERYGYKLSFCEETRLKKRNLQQLSTFYGYKYVFFPFFFHW